MSVLSPGTKAPAFRLPTPAGDFHSLTEFLESGPVWLVFSKSSCPTCELAIPFTERAHRSIAGRGPSVVVVSEDTAKDAQLFAERFGLTLPVLVEDRPYPVSKAYALTNVPSFFIVERDGTISGAGVGFLKWEWETAAADVVLRSGEEDFHLFTDSDDVPDLKPG
jgi:peroxiredoxin